MTNTSDWPRAGAMACLLLFSTGAHADYRDMIGYYDLPYPKIARFPDGSGVTVLVYDPDDQKVVLMGGYYTDSTNTQVYLDDGTSTAIPAARQKTSSSYGPTLTFVSGGDAGTGEA